MRSHSPAVALSIYVKQLHDILHIKRFDKYKVFNNLSKIILPSIMMFKFIEEVRSMRASKSFVFTKLPRTHKLRSPSEFKTIIER